MNPLKKNICAAFTGMFLLGATNANAVTVLVDFGTGNTLTTTDSSMRQWNNIGTATAPLTDAKDTGGGLTGMGIAINSGGTAISADPLTRTGEVLSREWPVSAAQDPIYHSGTTTVTITALDVDKTYTLDIFSARIGGGNSRKENFSIVGLTTETQNGFEAYNNTGELVSASLKPDATGKIVISLSAVSSFTYMNVLQVSYVPEPSAALLSILGLSGFLLRRKR